MDSNQSSYFLQQTCEDGSVDWNTFSFKSELATRKEAIQQDLKEFMTYATCIISDSTDTKDIIKISQENKEVHSNLLEDNKTIWSQYDNLINKHRSLEESLDKLLLKNKSLTDEIKDREEEEISLRKTYQLQKTALSKGIEMYAKSFDLEVDVKDISDSTYQASLKFASLKESPCVQFTINRNERRILGFDVSGEQTPTKESLHKYISDLPNLPGLLCSLRNVLQDNL